jgi:hypothetical protein
VVDDHTSSSLIVFRKHPCFLFRNNKPGEFHRNSPKIKKAKLFLSGILALVGAAFFKQSYAADTKRPKQNNPIPVSAF